VTVSSASFPIASPRVRSPSYSTATGTLASKR
jgi:hypothetical protein